MSYEFYGWKDEDRYVTVLPLWWTPDGVMSTDWNTAEGRRPVWDDGVIVVPVPEKDEYDLVEPWVPCTGCRRQAREHGRPEKVWLPELRELCDGTIVKI